MNKLKIAVIVAAYNRPDSLQRILGSISDAYCPDDIEPELIISIDNSGSDDCYNIASEFQWLHGKKTVIHHDENLGLKKHILSCGDLSSDYDYIILLEDDLYVSRYFLGYTVNAYDFYKADDKLAGFSLYTYCFNETAHRNFTPVTNGSDVYFLQLPSSWGQVWTRRHWEKFRVWLDAEYSPEESEKYLVPTNVLGWPDSSWKKLYIIYMVVKDLYFVYPRVSLSTNFMDIGTHHTFTDSFLQVPLQAEAMNYVFRAFGETSCHYDSFCELLPAKLKQENKNLETFDFEVDMYGTKPLGKIRRRYILTNRSSFNSLYKYALALKPHELNVIYDVSGGDFCFARTVTISENKYLASEFKRKCFYFNIPGYLIEPNKNHVATQDKRGVGECVKEFYRCLKKTKLKKYVMPVKKTIDIIRLIKAKIVNRLKRK